MNVHLIAFSRKQVVRPVVLQLNDKVLEKVLYTSGYTGREELEEIDPALLLDKPYTMQQLTARIAELMMAS